MSIDGINDGIKNWSIRWDRLFTTVSGDGQPKSYFQFFLNCISGFTLVLIISEKEEKQRRSVI